MIDIIPEDVITWDIEKLWNYFDIISQDDTKSKELKEQIKYGIKHKFPIWYVLHEWYEIRSYYKIAVINGYGKIPINEFMEEIEKRTQKMREYILKKLDKEELVTAR